MICEKIFSKLARDEKQFEAAIFEIEERTEKKEKSGRKRGNTFCAYGLKLRDLHLRFDNNLITQLPSWLSDGFAN